MSNHREIPLTEQLPLNPFEQYMLVDDRVGYPMVFRIRLTLARDVDCVRVQQAIAATLRQHPLLRSRISGANNRSLKWIDCCPSVHSGPNCPPTLQPTDRERPVSWIDLYHETGLRTQLCKDREQTILIFDFHHSCCDGLGALRFVEDFACSYASPTSQTEQPVLKLCQVRSTRATWQLFASFLLRLPQEMIGALFLTEYFSHKPISLAQFGDKRHVLATPVSSSDTCASSPAAVPAENIPRHLFRAFSWEEFSNLRVQLKSGGLTVNDHLVASVLAGIDNWRKSLSQPRPASGHFRILIPMNMRSRHSSKRSSANDVSMVYFDHRPWKYKSFSAFRRHVRLHLAAVKLLKLGHTFIRLFEVIDRLRIGLRWMLPPSRCMGTTVASNLGVIFSKTASSTGPASFSIGNCEVQRVEVYPPVRPHTSASFICYTFANQFYICMTYADAELSEQHAASLLQAVASRFAGVDETV